MPWTPAQARGHKKDLTDSEAKTWAKVANGERSRCIGKGGTPKHCDGQAIRVANAAINQARKKQMIANDGRDIEHVEFIPLSELSKAAIAAPSANAVHGQGGTLSNTRGGYTCKCKCGHEYQSNEPCKDSKCPKCKEKDMNKPSLSKFTIYKSHDGTYRWETVSNVAIMDKEKETVSERAYDDAIVYAVDTGEYGELDLVHVDGTEIGKCDRMKRLGQYLIEEGYLYDTERSKRVCGIIQSNPTYWGVSIKFVYDPEQFVDNTYQGGIRILKRSVLPRHMAASHGTAIAVAGGAEMAKSIDEEQVNALKELGETEEDIEALTEKQKALPADEENVVEKDSESSSLMSDIRSAVWGAMREVAENLAVGKSDDSPEPVSPTTDVEEKSTPEVKSEDNEAQDDEQEKQTEQAEPTAEEQEKATGTETDESITSETLQSFGVVMTKMFAQELAKVKLELEKEKAQREQVEKALSETNKRLEELAKPIEERVNDALAEVPKVVKVHASHSEATVHGGIVVRDREKEKGRTSQLMGDIANEVARKQRGGGEGKYEV